MEPHLFRVPKTDQSLLVVPDLDQSRRLLDRNETQLSQWEHDFQGRPACRLRAMARKQVLDRAREHLEHFGTSLPNSLDSRAPLIVTGHQPELFHPGVWIKNFAVAELARQQSGTALNLIVDNDIPKSATLRVPHSQDGRLGSKFVEFDAWSGEVPFEDWTVADQAQFASFGPRVREVLNGLVPDPMIDDAWPEALAAGKTTDRIGLRFSAARRSLERSFGVANAEIPLSLVCETEAFCWFASHLLAHLPRFQATYNAAIARYRVLYRIRSKNHPVPLLSREGEWLESPFWVWRARTPRRRPLLARQGSTALDLRIAGESELLASLRLSPDREACCAVEELQQLAHSGIRIRTRALTTTMFARLLLADLFVHGIGGAKYDELGDEVIRGFFGIEPPSYLTLSMTLWLGIEADPGAASRHSAIERTLRDLQYNPDRILANSADQDVQRLMSEKKQVIAGPVATRRERVTRFHTLRHLNESLARFLLDDTSRLVWENDRVAENLRNNQVAMGREWGFVLHSRSRWLDAVHRILPTLITR